ncbi:hypothetical protein EDB19DRAFT_1916461 [Suillus lakei]|nr:hypothetical protein EDB19DRAFT_1916461 [Suillus lakei]
MLPLSSCNLHDHFHDYRDGILSPPPTPRILTSVPPSQTDDHIPSSCIPRENKDILNIKLAHSTNKNGLTTAEPEIGESITYLPLWIDDNIAHGRHDDYRKQSQSLSSLSFPLSTQGTFFPTLNLGFKR